jgi:hypothetical protein
MMGKWMNKAINPSVVPESLDHIHIEDLARLAEGAVDAVERRHLIGHLNRCQRCYQILQETLKDVSAETTPKPGPVPWWRTKMIYALAVSIVLALLIGGPFAIKHWTQRPPVIMASLDLDQALKNILLEDDALKWEKKERVNRLLTALQQRGLAVKDLNLVLLSKPYYQKKSLFGPKEVLQIRIENKVAYLEVKEMDN